MDKSRAVERLDATEVVRGTADDTLNSILETLESLEYGNFTDALRYVALIEEGMEKVREQAVMDAALGGEPATAMSEALGGSRQTFYRKYSSLLTLPWLKPRDSCELGLLVLGR